MTYSALPTVSTGDSWSAANHNTYIKDNFAASAPSIFTTKGDMVIAEGADTVARLAIGNTGKVLVALSSETLGVNWGDLSDFINVGRYTSSDWDGATAYDTVVYIDATSVAAGGFALPATAKMLFGVMECRFNSGASTDFVMLSSTAYATSPMIRCEWRSDTDLTLAAGALLLAEDKFTFDPNGSNVNVKIEFWGYME